MFAAEVRYTSMGATSHLFARDADGRAVWKRRAKAEAAAQDMAIFLHLPGTQVDWSAINTKTLPPAWRKTLEAAT